MKRKQVNKWLAGILTAGMLVASLSGCSLQEKSDAKEEAPAAEATETPQEKTEEKGEEAKTADSGLHEIYSLLPDLALTGLISPDIADRTDVEKAWPKTPADPAKLKIGWTEINQSSDFFIALKDTAEEKAKEYGWELSFLIANDDPQTQSQHIDTFISQDVDIIVVDPVNSSAPIRDIERAIDAGIPVLCVGTEPEACGAITTFCTNPFIDGFQAGEYTSKLYQADEDVLATVIIGVMGSSTSESRVCGQISGMLYGRMEAKGTPYACVEDAYLDGYHLFQDLKTSGKGENAGAGVKILGYGTGSWTVEGGLDAAEDLCTANPDMNCLIAENDFMAAGAIKALKSSNMMENVKVYAAADGTAEGLKLIQSGELVCTGLGSPVEEASYAMDFINAIFNEGKDCSNLPMSTAFNIGIITKDNVNDYYEEGNKFYKTSDFVYPKSIAEIREANS
ncbi:MAG: sugar ABC transporter substrate-binding protein [Blautia sp.]|jgi:ribose transport system substrate-binding protein